MQDEIKNLINNSIKNLLIKEPVETQGSATIPETEVTIPPGTEPGDFSSTILFKLAKEFKKSPKDIYERLRSEIVNSTIVSRVEFVNGYLNIWVKKDELLKNLLKKPVKKITKYNKAKPIDYLVEHTSANPNKALHLGHIRNATLGDSITRLLSFLGYKAVPHSYDDDLGNQVVFITTGFLLLKDYFSQAIAEEKDFQNIINGLSLNNFEIPDSEKSSVDYLKKLNPGEISISKLEKVDHIASKVYVLIQQLVVEYELIKDIKEEIHKQIESCEGAVYEFSKKLTKAILKRHIQTMENFSIFYDFMISESSIIKLDLWDEAFEILKKTDNFTYETNGKNAGCWVLKNLKDSSGKPQDDKVLVKSNGIKVYTAKDIALHLWKFGLLRKQLFYKNLITQQNGSDCYISEEEGEEKNFNGAKNLITVVDSRQDYVIDAVKQSIIAAGFDHGHNMHHLSYAFMTLSPETAQDFGAVLTNEEKQKKSVAFSGRKGVEIKVDDLLQIMSKKIMAHKLKDAGKIDLSKYDSIFNEELEFGEQTENESTRTTVSAILLDEKTGKTAYQEWQDGLITLVGGGVNADESLEQALRREIIEETGFYDITILGKIGDAVKIHRKEGAGARDILNINNGFLVLLHSKDKVEQNLDEYEKGRFVVKFGDADEVLQKKQECDGTSGKPHIVILERFKKILEQEGLESEDIKKQAQKIAAGAIRYFMLKFNSQTEIVFDIDEALKSDGNTGVYILYSFARAGKILSKMQKSSACMDAVNVDYSEYNFSDYESELLSKIADFERVIAIAFEELSTSRICDYAFDLCKSFSRLYTNIKVLSSDNSERLIRSQEVQLFYNTLSQLMEILGLEKIEEM